MPAITEDEDERDHAQAMIDWLADKDPDVWLAITPHLNWDSSFRVLDGIISQPRCDKANAAFVFWPPAPCIIRAASRVARPRTPRVFVFPTRCCSALIIIGAFVLRWMIKGVLF